ncbi:NaeI family type II restriction endonuclease [Streptomyces sp. NPDC101145]|uniref:NaeI family type II restriction endonuclease n=1 Tax=Streptomyces sp. NPDC101145 TaxID=3366112 RepID=UPI0038302906
MSDALGRVLAALRTAVPHLDAAAGSGGGPADALDGTALAEALWLAAAMAGQGPAVPAPADPPEPAAVPGATAPAQEGTAALRKRELPAPDPVGTGGSQARPAGARHLHERLPGAATRVRGHAVAAPRATGLPRALEVTRALRPWKRPWPEGRRGRLDIDATVDGYARSGELIPVFSPAPERWFDLTLVVDRSPQMRVWEETLDDFTGVLDRLGAFRTLQVRDLRFDDSGGPQAPGQLRQADGRRLVVVVSDCVAEPWRRPPVWLLLREWAATTPVALLNPLPTKLWRRGGLNLPTVRFAPAAPGAHRSRLPHAAPPLLDLSAPGESPPGGTPVGGTSSDGGSADGTSPHLGGASRAGAVLGGAAPAGAVPGAAAPGGAGRGGAVAGAGGADAGAWLPIPVLALSPHSLDRWSRALMRGAPEGCTAVLVPPGGRLPGRPRPRALPASPGTAARGFLRTASPRAVRLAVLCAPFDRLSLRLLHVIRRELVPDATTADVAEAVTSGLFELGQGDGDAGSLELVLSEDVRAVLRERLPAHEAWRVHQALDRYVASRGDGRPGLRSVAYDEAGPRELPAEQEAFARASRQTLELLGLSVPAGEPAEPDRGDGGDEGRDNQDPHRAETEGWSGTSDGFPPPPDVFIGDVDVVDSLVAQLAAPTAGVVWVSAVEDTPGTGRTALALHVAHRFAGERYYVDLRGSGPHPVPPEAALHRLLTEMGASPGPGPHTARELAARLAEAVAGRRVLLVLDDVADPGPMRDLLPVAPGCAVLATVTGVRAVRGHRLLPLTGDDAVRVVAAWAGLDGDGDREALRQLTADRVWWPRTLRLVGSWIASGSAPPLAELSRLVGTIAVAQPAALGRAVLDLRLRHLPADDREALALLARLPTGEVTRTEAWALLGNRRAALTMLDRLARHGLLDRRGAGVYRMPQDVRRQVLAGHPHDARAAVAVTRLVRHHLAAAAALHEEERPGSALAENLRVRATEVTDDGPSHVWPANALALAAEAATPARSPDHFADLLLLLHVQGASTPYRSRFEEAARALIEAAPAGAEQSAVRAVVALALAQYAAGAVGEAAQTLGDLPSGAWDEDPALRGPANQLAGRLAWERGRLEETEAFLRRALDAYRTDGDRFGVATCGLDLASVLTRLGWTDEVLRTVLEALGSHRDSVPHPLMRRGLLALEEALAAAGRHRELLTAQEALISQYRTEGGNPHEEGLVLVRMARTLIALGRLPDAEASAQAALSHLDAGPEGEAGREEARQVLAAIAQAAASPGPGGPAVVLALAADGDVTVTGQALSLALASLADVPGMPRADHRMLAGDDRCVMVLPSEVPLDTLLVGLAQRLPDELEAAGGKPAARLAVHVGDVSTRRGGIDDSDPHIGLTVTMAGSRRLRDHSRNFPFHTTLCLSPEAFERLGGRDSDGLVAGRFTAHEVVEDGQAVCVVLTPRTDLSAYDAELLMLARVFSDGDPDGRLMAAALRKSIDSVLDPELTGRYDPARLDERERELLAGRLARELRAGFPAAARYRLKLSLEGAGWAFSPADHGDICLVVRADEEHARWSAGLVRIRPGMTVAPVHADAPSPLTPEARTAVLWLHRAAPLRENLLLRLRDADRAAILAPASAVERTAELFRRVRERPVTEAALRPVSRRRDNARTVREAAALLREEGVLVVGGNRRGREVAGALRLPVPDADAYVSVRLTRRRPHHAGPSLLAGGVAWVVAGPDDPLEPLPRDLPNPRRPR